MTVWEQAQQLTAEETEDESVWDKAGNPVDEEQQLYRNLTDTLLEDKHIESFLASKLPDTPLGYQPTDDDRKRLTEVIQRQENPKRFRDKLAVSLYLANAYGEDFGAIYNRYDTISKEIWGTDVSPTAALGKILQADRKAFGLNRKIDYKGFWQATTDAYTQAGMGMVSEIAGLSRMVGELRSGWSAGQVQWAENLSDWGKYMYEGVKEHYKAHPEEFIQAKGDGFWDTTYEYITHPVAVYQGVLQSMPLVMEGIAGGMITGGVAIGLGASTKTVKFATWLGRVQGMAAPITGRKYAELRSLDVEPVMAMPQAILTGQIEAIIEEWTLGKKLALFKGAGISAKIGIRNRVMATIIGGSKAYGRGVLEEGSQKFNENFWNWVFTDRDQKWMEDVMSEAAAGGPMEMVMAGGFAGAGAVAKSLTGKRISQEEKLRRIEIIREVMSDSNLSPQEVDEINKVCDDVRSQVEAAPEPTPEAPAVAPVAERPAKAIEVPPEPQNVAEEIEQVEIIEAEEENIPPMTQAGGTIEETITPDLYIGNVTRRMKKKFAEIWERQPEEVKGFLEKGFPTKRTGIEMTRGEATEYLNWLVSDLDNRLANNLIRTENDLAWANADWGDITALRTSLGYAKGARPFKVIRAEKRIMKVIKNTKSRIWAAIKGVPEHVTVTEALRSVMKGMSRAAQKGYMQGARDTIALHKNLNKYAREQLKGLDMKKSQWTKLMTAIAGARTDAQRIAAHALIDILAEQSNQAKAAKKIRKTVAYINRKIGAAMQEKGIRPEYYEKIKAITDIFKLKPDSAKLNRSVRSLKIHLENLQGEISNQYDLQYEIEMIPESMIKRLDKINAIPIQKMKAAEIEFLNDTLQQLVHNNETKNKLILNGIARDLIRTLNGAVEELDNVRDISIDESERPVTEQTKRRYGALHSFVTTVAGAKNHDIETLVDTLSGSQMGWAYEIFVEGIVGEGRDRVNDVSNRIIDEFKAAMVTNNISLADLQGMSKAFLRILKTKMGMNIRRFLGKVFGLEKSPTLYGVKIAGRKQKFTMGELMSIYMHAQSGFNLKAIIEQGLATYEIKLGSITPAEILAISNIVEKDAKAKAFCDMAARVYENISKPEINKVSKGLMGTLIAKVERYWHVERYKTGGVAGAQRYRLSDLEQTEQLQEREGSDQPVIVRDFFEQFFNDMQAVSEYVGLAEPLRNARNLVNYKMYREILKDKGYGEVLGYLDTMLRNVQSLPETGGAIDAIASYLMRGTIKAVLAEPGIFLGQYASMEGIFNEMSHKYKTALRLKATEKDKARYKEHSPSIKARIERGVSSRALSYIAQSDELLRAFTENVEFLSWFVQYIHKVDTLVIIDICRAIEAEMQDADLKGKSKDYWEWRGIEPSKLEINSDEYWEAFRKRASFVIRRTQPMFNPENQSVLTLQKGAARHMWVLFRSYVNQLLRMAQRSITAYQNRKISLGQLSKDLANIWTTAALYTAIRFAVSLMLYRKDEDWSDLFLNMLLAPVRLLTFIGFPLEMIVKTAFDKTKGTPKVQPVPVGFANKMLQATNLISKGIGDLVTGEKYKSGKNAGKSKGPIELGKGFLLLSENMLMFYGVPEDVPRRIYEGWTKKEEITQYTAF